jgi:hypothetical protein
MNKNEQYMAEKIRTQYTAREYTEMDKLRALDAKVKRPANAFAYFFGSIAAIVMGTGMSLVMTDIGSMIGIADGMLPGIVIGVVGMFMALINYPIHRAILKSRKRAYSEEILTLSNRIINQ